MSIRWRYSVCRQSPRCGHPALAAHTTSAHIKTELEFQTAGLVLRYVTARVCLPSRRPKRCDLLPDPGREFGMERLTFQFIVWGYRWAAFITD